VGSVISRSGFANRAESWAACAVEGVRARRLVGRWERGSWEVGMDSGMGSDILWSPEAGLLVGRSEEVVITRMSFENGTQIRGEQEKRDHPLKSLAPPCSL
jgi:hypothetical protein